ncbi:MAG: SRPBCC domain-containing protein [Pseudolysinimonas sp.]
MGMTTSAQIQIAKPAADVFRWLIEPAKLTQWAGAAGLMPADTSLLKSGFETTGSIPAIAGEVKMRVENYNPPLSFAVTMTYDGGDSTSTYTLSESGGTTTLTSASDSDWAKPDLSGVETMMDQQSAAIQSIMHHAIDVMNQQVGSGSLDANAQGMMQQALLASLQKLKGFVEAG